MRKSFKELVTQIVVAFGFFPKTLSVRGKRASVLDCLGGELPTVRRKKPRPA
jgi:hypothetical protein